MKKHISAFLLLLFIPVLSYAQKWHPFPFKTVYIGNPDKMAPLQPLEIDSVPGTVVEALNLDSSWMAYPIQYTGSKQPWGFSISPYSPLGTFRPRLHGAFYWISTDSSEVNFTHLRPEGFPNDKFEYQFLLKVNKTGQIACRKKSTIDGVTTTETFKIMALGTTHVFGNLDSVRYLSSTNSNQIVWSKKFGILSISGTMEKIVGINDLQLGLHGFDDSDQTLEPEIGDEVHVYDQEYNYHACNGQYFQNQFRKTFRYKLISKTIGTGSPILNYEVIQADSGSTTGIQYGMSVPFANTSKRKLGSSKYEYTDPGFTENVICGWIPENGSFTKLKLFNDVMDLGTTFYYEPCVQLPVQLNSYHILVGSGLFCLITQTKSVKPTYFHTSTHCNGGTPFPSVTITATKKKVNSELYFPYPNPGRNSLSFGSFTGDIQLLNIFGQEVLNGRISGIDGIDVSFLPDGVYHYQLSQDFKIVSSGKWIHE